MASGKWERVGKGGKPANKATGQQKSVKNIKDNDKPLDGSQLQLTGRQCIYGGSGRNSRISSMQTLSPHFSEDPELSNVVKVNQTKFSSFSNDDGESAAPPTSTSAAVAGAINRNSRVEGKKQTVQRKKAHNIKEPRPSTISLKDAMNQLDANDIKEFVEQAQEQYPDDSLAWFKELIGYFRQRLSNHHMLDDNDNIVSMVPMETRKILIGCFKALKEKTLELLFIHALNDISTSSHKGADVVGVMLLVELLKLSHPSIVDKCTEMAQVMLQSCISRPRESVPLLRAILLDNFQQQNNTEHGIKALCKVLLPLIRNTDNVPRLVITFAINYLYQLFAGLPCPPALPLSAVEFVSLLQTTIPTQVAGDQVMLKRFSQFMLTISRCVVKLKNSKPSQCFQQLLWTLEKHNEPRPPQQLLQSSMLCVSHDVQCQALWKNHRQGNQANKLLIQYLAQHWNEAENFATQNKCLDGLLSVLRSPHMVTLATVNKAPWNETIRRVDNAMTTSSRVVNSLMLFVIFIVVLLLLGNYICQYRNDNVLCVYVNIVMMSIKWIYHHVVSMATSLQSWLLSNISYWDSVSSVGYQVCRAIVTVYATAWEMLLALWQVLLNCYNHIHTTTIVMKQ